MQDGIQRILYKKVVFVFLIDSGFEGTSSLQFDLIFGKFYKISYLTGMRKKVDSNQNV